jgi:hypothetical protein
VFVIPAAPDRTPTVGHAHNDGRRLRALA